MRSCIYCGKELKDKEVCQCPQSVKMRAEKASQQTSGDSANTYQTGYMKKEGKFKHWQEKQRTKAKVKVNRVNYSARDIKDGIVGVIRNMLFHPVEAVSNPGRMNIPTIIVMNVILGLLLACVYVRCLYFFLGGAISIFLASHNFPAGIPAAPIMIFGMTIIFTLLSMGFTGVLYLINRFIMRQHESYWVFSSRMVTAYIPLILASAAGLVISLFTPYGMLMFLASGLVMTFILVYEGMRTQWLSLPASIVFYVIGGATFIFAVICYNIFRFIL